MGRVHKKKMAQYQKDSEAAETDEQSVASGSKDDSGRENALDAAEDGNNSDADNDGDVPSNTSLNASSESKKNSSANDGEQLSEHEDDSDVDGGDSEAEAEEKKPSNSNKNGKRTATKRKPGPKKVKPDEDEDNDEEDEDNNEKRSPAKRKPGPKKHQSDEENDDDDNDDDFEDGKKAATKRKAAPKKVQSDEEESKDEGEDDDDDGEDYEPTEKNGGGPAKRGRKAKPKASQVKRRGRKPKTVAARKHEEDDDDEDEKDDDEEEEAAKNNDSEEDENDEYEVKDIVGHKIEKGVNYYLIRWQGYTKDDDTWESENTLSCQDLIDKYNKKNNNSKPAAGSKAGGKQKSTEIKRRGRPKNAGAAKKQEDPEKEWEVDKIIDYAEEKDGRQFRIRWKGYGPKYDTWEPEANLSCADLIEKFMKKMESQKDVTIKHLRELPKKTKRLVNETQLPSEHSSRKSKRSAGKKRIMYADSDE